MRHCARCGTAYPADERFCPLDGGPVVEARAAADPVVGKTLGGRYLIVKGIGKGGMGAVYEAEHVGLGKRVAVKLLLDQFSEDREVLARFHQEARTASRVGHENIIDILDIGDHDGRSYIVMEFLEGHDLRRICLDHGGPLPLARTVGILKQITRGLAAAHQKGVIHRDMKPENVFITEKHGAPDFVKVMDFGISKIKAAHDSQVRLTQTGAVIGTPMYMAPEQGMGRTDIDHRADVYSVGVMMFEMFCGRPPFQATTYLGLMTQHLQEPPPPPRLLRADLSPEIERVILRALEKDPERRFGSMRELGDALPAVGALSSAGGDAGTSKRTVIGGSGALTPPGAVAPGAASGSGPAAGSSAGVPVALPALTSAATVPRAGGAAPGRRWIAAVAAVAVVAAAVAVALVVRGGGKGSVGAPSAAGSLAAAPVAAVAPDAAGPTVTALATSGSLEIDSTPRGATVFVDGLEQGHTPLVIEQVAVGSHRVRLALAGYEIIETDKPVRAGTAETFFGAMSKARKGSRGGTNAGDSTGPTSPASAGGTGAGSPGDAPRDAPRDAPGPDKKPPPAGDPVQDGRPPAPPVAPKIEPARPGDRPGKPGETKKPNPYIK